MSDTAIAHQSLRCEIDPDDGSLALEIGSASLRGRCYAEFSLTGRKLIRATGGKPASIVREPAADENGKGERLAVNYGTVSGLTLALETAIYPKHPFIAIRLGVTNPGTQALKLDSLTPFDTMHLDFGSGPLDGWVNGYHSWSFAGFVPHNRRQPRTSFGWLTAPLSQNTTTRMPNQAGCYVGEELAALIDGHEQALVAGFIGMAEQFGQIHADGRPGKKSLTLQTTADGIPLEPGQTVWSEWAVLYLATLPDNDPLGPYAEAVTRLTPGRFSPTPPEAGWSSWYQFFADITADDMARNQQALRGLQDHLPLKLIQLDDGYQPAWGDWLSHNDKFPQGVEGWAESVHKDGFEPGLWLSPFSIDNEASIFRDHPDAILRGTRNRPIHGGFLINRWLLGLDPTHPATQDHVRETVNTIVHKWNIPYLKLDFLYCGALPGRRHNPHRTRAQALRDGLKLIREVAGEDTMLVGCGCPSGPALGVVDVMRISPDCAPDWYPRLFGLQGLVRHDRSLPATCNAIRNSIQRSWTHRRWWWLDADNLLVREQQGMTVNEIQSYATIIGLTGSHLVQSDDLTNVADERLRWVSLLLPALGDRCLAPNLLTAELPEMLVQHRQGAAGEWTLVGLFNWSDRPARHKVNLEEIGFPAGTPTLVCDFWKGRLLIQTNTLRTNMIPPHGVALFGLRAVTPEVSQFAGSNLHLSMGAEITKLKTTKKTIRLTVDLGHPAKGTIWLKLPAPPKHVIIQGEEQAVPPPHSAGIYAIRVSIDRKTEIRAKF